MIAKLFLAFMSMLTFATAQFSTNITRYKTFSDYNGTSVSMVQFLMPLRDAVQIINPYFVILFGLLIVLTTASYFTYNLLTGKTRFFNSLLASSFAVFVISVFLSFTALITPYHTLMFLGITVLSYILVTFYRR